MTVEEARELLNKDVYIYNKQYCTLTGYILRGVRPYKDKPGLYAVLQDKKVKHSYVKARLEDIRSVGV